MNGYNEHMVTEMVAAIDLARQDDEVRVLIITGPATRFAPEETSAARPIDTVASSKLGKSFCFAAKSDCPGIAV
jgi:hypothetical protein